MITRRRSTRRSCIPVEIGDWSEVDGVITAGPRATVLSTILAGTKRHRIEPWAYVRELLVRLHADDARLEEMLPDRWATSNPQFVLAHRLEESRTKAAAKRDRRQRRRALAKQPR